MGEEDSRRADEIEDDQRTLALIVAHLDIEQEVREALIAQRVREGRSREEIEEALAAGRTV